MRVAAAAPSAPIAPEEFARAMAPFAPFEPAPRLAVAVSGGGDSMALALLADHWAKAAGGAVVALTVDHRLRAASAAEAAQVGAWMAAHGIEHHVLARDGGPLSGDVQAQARAARHGLLGAFCAARGILHLLLAHHREDQAETLLLRLGRGSGLEGLSAMEAERPTRWGRLLRPLLDTPSARLRATLTARGQDWIEDPSNQNAAFARVRIRRLMPLLAPEGLSDARLAATARSLGRARAALEEQIAHAAALWVRLDPAGYAWLDPTALTAAPDEVVLRLLARLLMLVGGAAHPPRLERLERLAAAMRAAPAARTLGGCRLAPAPAGWLVARESRAVAAPVDLIPAGPVVWDGRVLACPDPALPAGLRLGALGAEGWAAIRDRLAGPPPPAGARVQIPALFDDRGVCAVPALGYNRTGAPEPPCRLELLAAAGPGLAGALPCGGRFRHYIHEIVSDGDATAAQPGSPAQPGRTRP